MIDEKTFTLDWIMQIAKQHRNADKILIEKAIRALSLLSCLKTEGLNFVFKGGTALMLMLGDPKRLSIDIDIIIPEKTDNLENILNAVIQNSSFIRFSEHTRSVKSEIEKAHYKFYYTPAHQTHSQEEYILLDILFESIPYQRTHELPVSSSLLVLKSEPVFVNVPSFEGILGDKMTAFAPNTTGIPYFKNEHSMSMEILKQIYDIGNLFDTVKDMTEVKAVFTNIAQTELEYRNLNDLQASNVLDDILETSLGISTRGMAGNCNFIELQNGVQRIKQFIISETFQLDKVIEAASKAAYLAAIIKMDKMETHSYSNSIELESLTITNTYYNKINKLKKNNRIAFWYWYCAVATLDGLF